MGALVEGTIEKLRECMAREADELNGVKQTKAIQIIITTEDASTCEPVYRVLKNQNYILKEDGKGGHTKDWSFKELLDEKMDPFGYEARAKEYLRAALAKLGEDHNTDPERIEIRVITPDNDEYPRPIPYLFIDKKPVPAPKGQLTFARDIFQE